MPIYDGFGYEDAGTGFEGFPVVGTLRKGIPKEQGLKELPYFRWDMKPGYEEFLPVLYEMFGPQPTLISGMILTGGNRVEKLFPHWLMEFTGNGVLKNKCDGKTCVKHLIVETGEYSSEPVTCFRETTGCACEHHATLTFYLPEFTLKTGVFGQFVVPMTSKIEILQVRAYLYSLQRLGVELPRLLFNYRREQREIQIPKPGKGRAKTRKYINVLEVLPEHMTGVIETMRQKSALGAPSMLAIADSAVTAAVGWDEDVLIAQTSGMFDNPAHQENAIDAAQKLAVLLPGMDTDTALRRFRAWRNDRNERPKLWADDVAVVQRLIQRANSMFGMSQQDVSEALRVDAGNLPEDWYGIPNYVADKGRGWIAVCLAGCDYEAETVNYQIERGNIPDSLKDELMTRLSEILNRSPKA